MTLWFVCRVRNIFFSKWASRGKLSQVCVQYEATFLFKVCWNFLGLCDLCVECAAFFLQNQLPGENSFKFVYSMNPTFSLRCPKIFSDGVICVKSAQLFSMKMSFQVKTIPRLCIIKTQHFLLRCPKKLCPCLFVCGVWSFFPSKWDSPWKLLQICVQYELNFLFRWPKIFCDLVICV